MNAYSEILEGERSKRRFAELDAAALLKLKPLDQTAELMALGFDAGEIASIRGLANRGNANAQIQRIRGQLGWQAS